MIERARSDSKRRNSEKLEPIEFRLLGAFVGSGLILAVLRVSLLTQFFFLGDFGFNILQQVVDV